MSAEIVANRYASALFQLAKEAGSIIQCLNELELVENVYKTTPKFHQILIHPKIPTKKKMDLVKNSFAGNVSESVLNTLLLIIERGRANIILAFIDKFKQLAYEEQEMAQAKVYSVKPLSEEYIQAISEVFAKKVGKEKLIIENIVDEDLIGGLKIRIGNRIFDGSIKGQLDRLHRQLIAPSR